MLLFTNSISKNVFRAVGMSREIHQRFDRQEVCLVIVIIFVYYRGSKLNTGIVKRYEEILKIISIRDENGTAAISLRVGKTSNIII